MANFFSSIGDVLKQTLWDQPIDIAKNVAKGDFKEAFGDFKSTFGDNNRELSDVFNSVGIRGKIGDNPQEAIGATVGTILGGWAAAPAMGAGAAGATGAGATGAGMAYTPLASTALGGSGATMAGTGLMGTGTAGTATGLGLGSEIGAGAAAFAPEAGSAMAYAPTASSALSTPVASGGELGIFDKINNGVQALNKMSASGDQQQAQAQPMQLSQTQSGGGGLVKAFGNQNNASNRARQNKINMIANNPFTQNKFMGGQ